MGIGQAIAFRLAEAGAGVMIADIAVEAANQTAEQIKARGGKAQAIRADAGSAADAQKVLQATVKSFGSLDILVNNAGIYPQSPLLEISEEMWDQVHDLNLKGVFFYSQIAAREMIRAGRGGKIINLASTAALHPERNEPHYIASKAGVLMLTKALALELAPYRILVNAVAPGGVETPGYRATEGAVMAAMGLSTEQIREWELKRYPLQRIGQPDDIARVVLFLASAAADYMTGSLILVDGGYLLS
jgi:2-deoxy-D-gluconate 3-dehydrogenase